MGYVVERLKEPSTHAGLAGVAQGLGLLFPAHKAILDAVTLIFGALAAATKG